MPWVFRPLPLWQRLDNILLMKKNRQIFTAILAVFLLILACSKDKSNSNGSSPSSENIDMTTDNGTWQTSNVIIYDQGQRELRLSATSTTNGQLSFEGITFLGVGTYDAQSISTGAWTMSTGTSAQAFHYQGDTEGPLSGTITFLDHDTLNDLISGSFDVYLSNVDDSSDLIHMTGIFYDLALTPGHPVQSNASAILNDSSFNYDYAMVFQIDDYMYLQLVNNINEIVTLRWNRASLGVSNYDVTQLAPIRVHYRNGSQIFTQQVAGNIDVTEHSAMNPGHTQGTYDIEISDFGSPPQYLEGSFDVNYN
jgi:hypothetical protein